MRVDIWAACKSHVSCKGAYSGKPPMGKIPGAVEKGIIYPVPPNCRMCQLWAARVGRIFVSGTAEWPPQANSWLALCTEKEFHYTKVILL